MQAELLRTFFTDFAVQQVAYIIYTFRYRVVRVQRMIKSFLACKRARKLVLEKMWLRMERKVTDEEVSGGGIMFWGDVASYINVLLLLLLFIILTQ